MFNDSVGIGLTLQQSNHFISVVDCNFSNNLCYNCHDELVTAQEKEILSKSNIESDSGGGLLIHNSASLNNVSIIQCQFSNNVANYDGGAIMV